MLDYLKDGWGFVCGVEGPNIQPTLMSELCGLSVTMCWNVKMLCPCGLVWKLLIEPHIRNDNINCLARNLQTLQVLVNLMFGHSEVAKFKDIVNIGVR